MATQPTAIILTGPAPSVDALLATKIDSEVKSLLDSGKADKVEEIMLSRIDSNPFDFSFFVPVIRNFVRSKKTESAEMFLELLQEACRARGAKQEEAILLRTLLSVWPESPRVRAGVLGLFSVKFGHCKNYKRLVDHCKVADAADAATAFRKLETWLRYEEGSAVYMPTKGVGRVREINPGLDAVRVTFAEGNLQLSFKLDEANRILEPLPPDHFLSDKLNGKEELFDLAKNNRGELLRRLFSSVNRQLQVNELRDMLSGLVSATQWASWWSDARKDRRLTVSKDNICVWNDSADDADTELLRQFESASIRDQIDMARKYSKRSPSMATAMSAGLRKAAAAQISVNPGLALELFLSLDKLSGSDSSDLKRDITALLHRDDATDLIVAIPDRISRKKAITLIRELRDTWEPLFIGLLRKESDTGSLAFMYDALSSLQREGANSLEDLVREIFQSPGNAPHFFVWLCQELSLREELKRFGDWSLIQTVLQLLGKDTIKEKNAALRKLFDDDGAVCFAARKLAVEQVKQFMTLLERDSSLEDYRREKMRKDLRAWFPQTEDVEDKTFFVSPEALAERQAEFGKITTVDIPQNTEEIIRTRAHGDLRENFEYHAARARQEMLSSRAKTLHDELQFARPIDRIRVDPSAVCAGTKMLLTEPGGGEKTVITILGPWDSNPGSNVISYLAPAGKTLLGKEVGDSVIFNGKAFTVTSIAVWKT